MVLGMVVTTGLTKTMLLFSACWLVTVVVVVVVVWLILWRRTEDFGGFGGILISIDENNMLKN
jgi:hypothetical protein